MPQATSTTLHVINLEYFFNLLYSARPGSAGTPDVSFSTFLAWLGHIWGVLGAASFVFSLAALAVLVYCTMRLHQIRAHEHHLYGTLDPKEAETAKDHSRWAHIQSLIESAQERDWRDAIMEADIMLDDMLVERGYAGTTLGERLKNVDGKKYRTLPEAWEAHKVRNSVAHEGMQFPLSDQLAYRTIKRYEAVFKEFGEI